MPDDLDKTIEPLLTSESVEVFAERFAAMVKADVPIRDYTAAAMAYAARHLLRDEYPRFVPHSYMGLIGAWQAREYLKGERWEDRHWPLAQQLWYMATERKSDPPGPEQSDFHCTAVAGLAAETSRAATRAELICRAASDGMNLGHKFIYLVKGLLVLQSFGYGDPERYLFAPLHYMERAPNDTARADTVDAFLLEPPPEPPKPTTGQPVTEAAVSQLCDALFRKDEPAVLAQIRQLGCDGGSAMAIQELLQLGAAELVYHAPHDGWLYAVHGYNFTDCLYHALRWVAPEESLRLLMIGGLYLTEMVGRIGDVTRAGPATFDDPPGEPPNEKRALGDALRDRTLAVGRVDGPAHFGHDIKFLYAAMSALKRSGAPSLRMRHIAAFDRFFARTDKPSTLRDILAPLLSD